LATESGSGAGKSGDELFPASAEFLLLWLSFLEKPI
jgi:hypothetical protein